MYFCLEEAGATKEGRSFDVRTRRGAFAGVIAEHYGKGTRVYFNSTATRGSKRVFSTIEAAIEYIYERRVKKGWSV